MRQQFGGEGWRQPSHPPLRAGSGRTLRPWLPVDLLDEAARTISENKAVMLGLPVVIGIALTVLQALVAEVVFPGGLGSWLAGEAPAGAAALVMLAVDLVSFSVVLTLISGLIGLATVRSHLGARVGSRELLRLVRPAVPALAGVAAVQSLGFVVLAAGWLLAALGSTAGVTTLMSEDAAAGIALLLMLAGVVLTLVLGVRLALAGTVVLLEGRRAPDVGLPVPVRVGVLGALRRSWRLVRGQFWRVLGILMFGALVLWLVGYAVQLGLMVLLITVLAWAGVGDGEADAFAIATGVAGGVGALLVVVASLAFMSALQASVYLDLRVRREGLDLWLRPALRAARRPARRGVPSAPEVGNG